MLEAVKLKTKHVDGFLIKNDWNDCIRPNLNSKMSEPFVATLSWNSLLDHCNKWLLLSLSRNTRSKRKLDSRLRTARELIFHAVDTSGREVKTLIEYLIYVMRDRLDCIGKVEPIEISRYDWNVFSFNSQSKGTGRVSKKQFNIGRKREGTKIYRGNYPTSIEYKRQTEIEIEKHLFGQNI